MIENVLLVTTDAASVTLTTTAAYVPAAVGVPDHTPAELTTTPGGKPLTPNHVYGVVPPVAAIAVDVYATPF
ncbi:MAG: hypothetical protein QOJ08_1335 [Ilumatobacteraceae bacterium]